VNGEEDNAISTVFNDRSSAYLRNYTHRDRVAANPTAADLIADVFERYPHDEFFTATANRLLAAASRNQTSVDAIKYKNKI